MPFRLRTDNFKSPIHAFGGRRYLIMRPLERITSLKEQKCRPPPKSTLPLESEFRRLRGGGDQGARLGTKDEAMEAEAREPLIARVGDGHYGGGGTDGYGSVMAAHGEATPAIPTSARRSPLTRVCPFILGNELCERLAYYGLSTNLVVYFHQVSGIFLLIPSHPIATFASSWLVPRRTLPC